MAETTNQTVREFAKYLIDESRGGISTHPTFPTSCENL